MTDPSRQDPGNEFSNHAWMESHQADLQRDLARSRSEEARWSWARLITFFGAVACLLFLRETPAAAWSSFVVGGILFFLSVRRHTGARRLRLFDERLLKMTAESLRRVGGRVELIRDWQRPEDPVESAEAVPSILNRGAVAELSEQERDDLDLYALPVGIFGMLNRTSSVLGARRLRDWLEHSCLSSERIIARQACVEWLSENSAARIRLMAAASEFRGMNDPLDSFVRTVRSAKPLPSPGLIALLRLWSLPSAIVIGYSFLMVAGGKYQWIYLPIVLMGVNWLFLFQVSRELRTVMESWRRLRPVAGAVLSAARQASMDLPQQTELSELRDRCAAVTAANVLPSLCGRIAWTDSGGIMHALCNSVFFYDIHVAAAVLHRVLPNRDALLACTASLADLEALDSLACFAWEQPVTCYAEPTTNQELTIIGGMHPLIGPMEAVANDVRLSPDQRTWIITGSNMSGKSTYLRMAGVNVLLAQLGTTATARAMTLSPRALLTDLRIRDNLAKHESYFLAEVRQLRRMLGSDKDPSRRPMLGLIDEPFRGTNSTERIAADVAVISELITSDGLFLVATHEEELADLADRTSASNHHFHEDLNDDGPVFDYRLRPGRATARNALRILEREDYPKTVLDKAMAWLKRSTTDE